MLRARTLLGVVVGGAIVYFFDPRRGAERRAQLKSWWDQRREPILETARQTTSAAQESVSQLSDQAAAKVSELKTKAQRSSPSSATVSGPYDTATAGTAGSREETETEEVPVRYRAYEGRPEDQPPSGDLPATQ
jgi:gas vesicle protein